MIEWHGKKVVNAAVAVLDDVSEKVANNVMRDAKRILKQKAKTTTENGLLSQFDVRKSKFKDGGHLVYCQGPGNWKPPYRASFVELGAHSSEWGRHKKGSKAGAYIPAKPFMRPARKKNIRKANRMFQKALDKL